MQREKEANSFKEWEEQEDKVQFYYNNLLLNLENLRYVNNTKFIIIFFFLIKSLKINLPMQCNERYYSSWYVYVTGQN